jgi:hypothetical protein
MQQLFDELLLDPVGDRLLLLGSPEGRQGEVENSSRVLVGERLQDTRLARAVATGQRNVADVRVVDDG